MRIVFVVEDGKDFTKLRQNVVVPRHVGRQYASDDSLAYLPVGEDDKWGLVIKESVSGCRTSKRE